MLRVAPGAGVAELQAAYRREMREIEAAASDLSAPDITERGNLLRLALNTLTDPVSRAAYDRKLDAARPSSTASLAGLALVPMAEAPAAASADTRADALALRADALALRADAMLLRTGVEPAGGAVHTAGALLLNGLKYFTRAIGILVLVAVLMFGITRCSFGGASVDTASAARNKAREQTVLQEYFQTHGVRPANIAEMELLEADRRRRENQNRGGTQDREQQDRQARQFEEESRRIAQEVSNNLRAADEQARMEAERDKAEQRREAEMKRYQEDAQRQAERERIEQQQREWRETLRK